MSDSSFSFLSDFGSDSELEPVLEPEKTRDVKLVLDRYQPIRHMNIKNNDLEIDLCLENHMSTLLRFIISDFTIFVVLFDEGQMPKEQIFLADVFDYGDTHYFPTSSTDTKPSFTYDDDNEMYTLTFNGTDKDSNFHAKFFVAEISVENLDPLSLMITNTTGEEKFIGGAQGDVDISIVRRFEHTRDVKYKQVSEELDRAIQNRTSPLGLSKRIMALFPWAHNFNTIRSF